LENAEKIRILVGLQTDRAAYDLLQRAKEQGELDLQSHATAKEQVAKDVLSEVKLFDETDRKLKANLKQQIETLIHELTNGRELFDFEIYFSEVFIRGGGFDVIIANPPYGANIDNMLPLLRPLYRDAIKNYTEIYKMFMQLGMRKIRKHGIQVFITPNTFLAQPRYKDIRKVLLHYQIAEIVNLGEEVFENVVVPTCISFIRRDKPAVAYRLADLSEASKFSGNMRDILFRDVALHRVRAFKDLSLYFGRALRDNEVLFDEALGRDKRLAKLAVSLEDDLWANAERRLRQRADGTQQEEVNFKVSASRPILDRIDVVLAKHYGLTNTELDFVLNYDIKYRMGDALEAD